MNKAFLWFIYFMCQPIYQERLYVWVAFKNLFYIWLIRRSGPLNSKFAPDKNLRNSLLLTKRSDKQSMNRALIVIFKRGFSQGRSNLRGLQTLENIGYGKNHTIQWEGIDPDHEVQGIKINTLRFSNREKLRDQPSMNNIKEKLRNLQENIRDNVKIKKNIRQ